MEKMKKNIDEGCLNDEYKEIEKPLEDSFHVSVAKINEYKEEERVNWAKKHQPEALKDFICHKEKAEILRTSVFLFLFLTCFPFYLCITINIPMLCMNHMADLLIEKPK